jgi:GT2 family glycosyltransferase
MKAHEYSHPLVSVITVNYNQALVTSEFLNSFKKVTYPTYEIILVDNCSPSREIDSIAAGYPDITYVKSKSNLGFAGGNNLGVKHASGEFVLFINNDTEVEPGFLQPLVSKLQESDQIGMVSPKIRFFYNPDTIQYAGSTALNRITMRNQLNGWNQKDNGQFDTATVTQFGHGAAMMVPSRVIQQVGMMADIYFLYYEEIDWCTRIKAAGYTIWYEPQSLVLHKESVSTGRMSPLKVYYITRNRILYTQRNTRGIVLVFSIIYLLMVAAPKNTLQYIFSGNFHLLKPYISAYLWHLKKLFVSDPKKNT